MSTAATGSCTCAAGYQLMPTLGCVECSYLIPGCFSCSEATYNTGLLLDNMRVNGVWEDVGYVTCDRCLIDERFVELNLAEDDVIRLTDSYTIPLDYSLLDENISTLTPVKCEACAAKFDACSYCGIYGDECLQCYPTHVLGDLDGDGINECNRCDSFMSNCLTCYSQTQCKSEKPRLLF
jgi:hypothetical protein